jgi:NAD(P)-dependent dehydrogenase (short-subunit alcohol dehydrogenase family)
MGALDGRIALVTGGGRGVGREHSLMLAAEGAKVVVNDLGGSGDGTGSDVSAAQAVVDEIRAMGGEAVANTDSVTSWEGAKAMVDAAVDAFGDLHVVVCNAGILRDKLLVNMGEDDFDLVMAVHVKGTYTVARHAAAFWRERAKAGEQVDRSIVTTTSHAGLAGNIGQVNYSAAKAAIAGMTLTLSKELGRVHGRANCVAPVARTRLLEGVPGSEFMAPPTDPAVFDRWDPANISPVVAWLASASCPLNGEVLGVHGDTVCRYSRWSVAEVFENDADRWTVDQLAQAGATMTPLPLRTQMDVVREQLAR